MPLKRTCHCCCWPHIEHYCANTSCTENSSFLAACRQTLVKQLFSGCMQMSTSCTDNSCCLGCMQTNISCTENSCCVAACRRAPVALKAAVVWLHTDKHRLHCQKQFSACMHTSASCTDNSSFLGACRQAPVALKTAVVWLHADEHQLH